MTILYWCLGIYLAIALLVAGGAWWINSVHKEGYSLWQLALIGLGWPLWLVGLGGAALYDRYR